ncbi:MAG: hypothetical protein KF689_05305 [Gemmatimonadaceae bacterium]|nr:hypothetical protein [Gemmatimonadaceae bacterium]MCW5825409.1 hypothetical protein [Gemmatimonadaceae bacterium]
MKFGASVAWAVVVLLIGLVVPSLDTRLVLIALALGVAMPVGDVFMNVLRGYFQAETEFWLILTEYLTGIVALYLFSLVRPLTATSAIMLLIGLGVLRTIAAFFLTRRFVRPHPNTHRKAPLDLVKYAREAVPVTIGALLGVGFSRLPSLTLHGRVDAVDYSVLIAFLSLFGRGELVVSAIMQAGFRSGHTTWKRLAQRRQLLLVLFASLAVPVVLGAMALPKKLTLLYLGPTYAESAHLVIVAAFAMLIYYPLYGNRLLLQFSGRNRTVISGGVVGGITYFVAFLVISSMSSAWQLAPYFAGLTAFLCVCASTLLREVREEEI